MTLCLFSSICIKLLLHHVETLNELTIQETWKNWIDNLTILYLQWSKEHIIMRMNSYDPIINRIFNIHDKALE